MNLFFIMGNASELTLGYEGNWTELSMKPGEPYYSNSLEYQMREENRSDKNR